MYEHRILEHAMVITQRYYLSMAFIDYFYQQIGLKFEEETNKMLHLEHGFVCAETWTLRAADQKYLESFEMWCWRRMEKISWSDHVRNEEVLLRVNEQRNILHEIRKRKANWICHILRRNCLLKQVIEGKIKAEMEVARRSTGPIM